MKPQSLPRFNLKSLEKFNIISGWLSIQKNEIYSIVMSSDIAEIFNLGGDLKYFQALIFFKNRDGLRPYA